MFQTIDRNEDSSLNKLYDYKKSRKYLILYGS